MIEYIIYTLIGLLCLIGLSGIRIVRPTERAVIEWLGNYQKFAKSGFNWIVPIFNRLIKVNITESMMDIEDFEAITKERLNTTIDLVVFYKIKQTEEDVKKSLYAVNDFEGQIVRLAQTTARNIIGEVNFETVNSKRSILNDRLKNTLDKESNAWGVEIVRVETKQITPPQDVQTSMNEVLKAENEKQAAVNRATARETEADGVKRANIKEAEGIAKGKIIVAGAEAQRIKLVNESAKKYFVGNAQKLRELDVAQASLQNNSKIILGSDSKNILKLFDIGK